MALCVYRDKCKNFKNKDFDRNECDEIGFTMMGLGINKISDKTIEEMVFRFMFIQKTGYNRISDSYSPARLRTLYKKYIGLEINYGKPLTRYQFMVGRAKGLEKDILWNIKWHPYHRIEQTDSRETEEAHA